MPTTSPDPDGTSPLAEVRGRFEQDGYVVVRDVVDRDLVAEANAHVDWLLAHHPHRRPEELDHHLARDDPFWLRLVADDRLVDLAEAFVGPDVALFATHYICKPPRTGQAVAWHQDGAFWPLDPMQVVTLWLAVTDSNPGNGCLRVIPGSHRTELSGMRATDGDTVLPSQIDTDIDDAEAVDLVLAPGDVSIHHPNIVHGSNTNVSDGWRRGLTIRYIPTTTRIIDPDAACPYLLRGHARDGVNSYLEAPRYVDGRHMPFAGDDAWR